MPRYNYECNKCKKKAYKDNADKLIINNSGDKELPIELYEELVLFETIHSMEPDPKELEEATICPRCNSNDCTKTVYGSNFTSFIRGYGFLDRAGAHRDMNRYKLAHEDPYAQYRVAGEVDHLDNTLKKKGQYDPKTKHFLASSATQTESKPPNKRPKKST